ncbi:MAG: flagellar protein FlaG [Litorivicinus sp.]
MSPITSIGSELGSLSVVSARKSGVSSTQATLSELTQTVEAMRDRLAELAMEVGLKVHPQTKAIMVEVTEMSSGAPILEFPLEEAPERMRSSAGDPRLLDARA